MRLFYLAVPFDADTKQGGKKATRLVYRQRRHFPHRVHISLKSTGPPPLRGERREERGKEVRTRDASTRTLQRTPLAQRLGRSFTPSILHGVERLSHARRPSMPRILRAAV